MRIRTIKPRFWRSYDITALPVDVRLLFVGLWSYVDDNGVGVDDYREITADLFALEDDQEAIRSFVREGLATLSRRLLVVRYKVEQTPLIFITTWDLHQKVDRPNKPRYPRPPADYDPSTSANGYNPDDFARGSRQTREGTSPVVGKRGRGEEKKKHEEANASSSSATATPPRDDVDQLCARLRDRMIGNGFKPPTITEDWQRQSRLLLDKDGRDLTQALRLIDWATADEFWHPNIKSMGKFRAQYDTLLARARQEHQRRTPEAGRKLGTTDQRVADIQALKHAPPDDDQPVFKMLLGGAS